MKVSHDILDKTYMRCTWLLKLVVHVLMLLEVHSLVTFIRGYTCACVCIFMDI